TSPITALAALHSTLSVCCTNRRAIYPIEIGLNAGVSVRSELNCRAQIASVKSKRANRFYPLSRLLAPFIRLLSGEGSFTRQQKIAESTTSHVRAMSAMRSAFHRPTRSDMNAKLFP
ncbi:MAG: hypothetical protein ACXVAO_19505, partial [Vulcanimicrobiaceae bacterium]